ncbi:MAG: hypothetical protein WCF63_03990 [Acidimicrobiales bacterium]|jgi:hypothetical protein
MSVVVMVRERARGSVSTPVVLWAVAMTVVLFMEVVSPSALLTVSGFVITALLGALLGWRRRMGTVIAAPFIGWLFAWFPMEIACMIHFGILKGFLLGLLVITFGWVGIGCVELAWLAMVALVVRSLRGVPSDDGVVIIDPEKH